MDLISNKFSIQNNELVNFQGQSFPAVQYESELHSNLAFHLQDPDLARTIHSAYVNNVADTLTEPEKELFSNALVRICYLFGTPKFPPVRALRLALLQEGFPVDSWMERHAQALEQFMTEANQGSFPAHMPKALDETVHIVITTTSAAGGNLAVAEGLERVLNKRFRVTVIDVEKLSEEVDPMMIATGTHTFDRIYAEVIQQANRMEEGFGLQMGLYRDVARYIEPVLGRILKEKIAALKADFILSTRNGHQLDLSLPHSLGIPGSVQHCDCEVGWFFRDFIGKVQSQLFKIWLPDNLPRVFQPVVERTKMPWQKQYQSLPWNEFKNVLGQAVGVSGSEIDEEMEFVGAPTRQEIYRIKDVAEIERLRGKWGLEHGEAGVLVSMGRNGVGRTRELFSELLKSPGHKLPIKYIFVCGTNEAMRVDFERDLKNADLSDSALKRCSIVGLASGTEMNELLNINTLIQGKPGGSIVEESLKTRIPMMVVFSHGLWESGGQDRLAREGYVLSYDSNEGLAVQTEQHVARLGTTRLPKAANRKWKVLIPAAIEKALA